MVIFGKLIFKNGKIIGQFFKEKHRLNFSNGAFLKNHFPLKYAILSR